jgi:hypothetical protein
MENNKKQTAVEWLTVEAMKLFTQAMTGTLNEDTIEDDVSTIITKAKEIDKQAHKETWDVAHQAGRFEGKGIAEENWQTFEGYWEENFKQQEQ